MFASIFFYSLIQLTTGTINKLFNKLANQLSSGFFLKEIKIQFEDTRQNVKTFNK